MTCFERNFFLRVMKDENERFRAKAHSKKLSKFLAQLLSDNELKGKR